MFLMLIATFAIGFASAGMVMVLFRLLGKRAPRHLLPVVAGAVMFSFMLWNEYTWYERALHSMPEDVTIAATYEHSSVFQPWTLLVPRINRFAVVDVGGARRNPEFPDQLMADVLLIKRFEPLARQRQVFDCAGFRRADPPAPDQGDDWTLEWADVGADDPLLRAACGT